MNTTKKKPNTSACPILLNIIRLFCATSSIHGLNHLADRRRHPVEVIIWMMLVLAAIYGVTILSLMSLTRYRENPTVITMERDRFSWNTSLPAVTMCPSFQVNDVIFEEYVSKLSLKNETLFRYFLKTLAEASYDNFENMVHFDQIRPENYLDLLLDLHVKFSSAISTSRSDKISYSSQLVVTEMGICYSFNSNLATYFSPNYWKEEKWELVDGFEPLHINPSDGSLLINIVNVSKDFKLYFHSPHEIADISSKHLTIENIHLAQIKLNALTIFSNEKIRSLSIEQRKCRFSDENHLRYSPAYSYTTCRSQCRASLSNRLCGCIPHFYRRLEGESVCDVNGLHCLAKYKEKLISLKGECSCLQNCDDVSYTIDDLSYEEWTFVTSLFYGLRECPRMRLRRDIIFGYTELLVGGMAGLFLGCSVLSFIEIIYFFTMKVCWFVVKYRKGTRRMIEDKH